MSYNFLDKTGLAYFWNKIKAKLDLKTNTSVIPNNSGEIKTKYRIANKAYTGGSSVTWYYPLCKLPTDNNGNYASAIISGRIGGWVSSNMSYINALAWNRSGTGISLLDIAGSGNMSNIWGTCDIVIYTDAETVSETTNDNGIDTVYLKCKGYFTFDLDLEMFQSTAEILYNGTYLTTEPTGTLVAQASTSTKRAELYNGKLYVAGSELAKASSIPTKVSQLTNDSGYTANTGTITGIKMNGATMGTSGMVDLGSIYNVTGIPSDADLNNYKSIGAYYSNTHVQNAPQLATQGFYLLVCKATDNYILQEVTTTSMIKYIRRWNGTVWTNWQEMKYTDTRYSSKTAASGGTDVSLVTTGEKYTWNNKTSNTGTVTSVAVKMNGSTKGTVTTSGTIDLGTVITAHQDISGKQDKLTAGSNIQIANNTISATDTKYTAGTGISISGNNVISATSSGGVTFDDVYPVGSIYMSINNTNPSTMFGGTWEQLKDRFLLGAGDTYTAGNTGGEANHQLTKAELPSYDLYNASHSHPVNYKNGYGSGGNYGVGYAGIGTVQSQGRFNTNGTTIKVSSGGSNTPHNNMPPYLAVYMWKRTA